jgi:integrase
MVSSIEPRNINRAFDIRCTRTGSRRITIHDTRRTCGSAAGCGLRSTSTRVRLSGTAGMEIYT